jgi:hypothetical protein
MNRNPLLNVELKYLIAFARSCPDNRQQVVALLQYARRLGLNEDVSALRTALTHVDERTRMS